MRPAIVTLACFLMVASCLAQQYPFVHYTPKDGLISNQVRNIYQDSKGRLYFTSANGLSVYDGSRFINYTVKDGLGFDIVNCIMEMGDDSIWIITNSSKINCLVKGQLKTLVLKDTLVPVINQLVKDEEGVLYAATDQGLYFLDKDRFVKLPFIDPGGKDINTFISRIYSSGGHLLVQRDNSAVLDKTAPLYLYNKSNKKISTEIEDIYTIAIAPDGRIWVTVGEKIMSVDIAELKKDRIILQELPVAFEKLKNSGGHFIYSFDREGNCWMGDQSTVLIKASPDGNITSFAKGSGLSMPYIQYILQDREGIMWIATNNDGVNKLVQSDLSLLEDPFGIPAVSDISYNDTKNSLLIYSFRNSRVAFVSENKQFHLYL